MSPVQDPIAPEPDLSGACRAGTAAPDADPRRPSPLAEAILRTLIYADLFDYPLAMAEIAHYLIGCRAPPAEVQAALAADPILRAQVDRQEGFYFLRGRAALPAVRVARAAQAARLRSHAARYIRLLRHFPFVRMIAVTGALAVDNVGDAADIDLLVISRPGRVWICRRLLVLAVHAIRLWGDEVCPNYILAADSLALAEQDLFTAHELAQMRPAAGYPVYQEMYARNPWVAGFLPNAPPWPAAGPSAPAVPARPGWLQRLGEALLGCRLFDPWERWELARLVRRLALPAGDSEVTCTPRQCKGHTSHYRAQVLRRYEERVSSFEF